MMNRFFKYLTVLIIGIISFFFLTLVVFISASIRTYKTITISIPEVDSFFYVTQVKTDGIFTDYVHYKYIIHLEEKSKKDLKRSKDDLIFLGESFGYYLASPDTLYLVGEVISNASFNNINGTKVIIRDYAHHPELSDEFIYDKRIHTLVARDELGKLILVTDADFNHLETL